MRVIELQYLPQPAYFALFLADPELKIDGNEYFVKQTYRNRCRILTPNGIDELTVPVLGASKKVLAKDIKIDYTQKWLNRHWRAIQSAYGKAPFFEYYAVELHDIFAKKHVFLYDLSRELLTQCLDFLQFDFVIKDTETYQDLKNKPENDLRSKISPKSNFNFDISYKQVSYQQVFGNDFVNNLSVIDLIFCEGPAAGSIIKSGLNKGTH